MAGTLARWHPFADMAFDEIAIEVEDDVVTISGEHIEAECA